MLVNCKNKPAVVFSAKSQDRFIIYYFLIRIFFFVFSIPLPGENQKGT